MHPAGKIHHLPDSLAIETVPVNVIRRNLALHLSQQRVQPSLRKKRDCPVNQVHDEGAPAVLAENSRHCGRWALRRRVGVLQMLALGIRAERKPVQTNQFAT